MQMSGSLRESWWKVLGLSVLVAGVATAATIYIAGQLRGRGVPSPRVRFVPAVVDFGPVEYPGWADMTTVLTNTGQRTVTGTVSLATTTGCSQFSIVSGGGAYTLPAGGTKNVVVRYTPADSSGTEVTCSLSCGP